MLYAFAAQPSLRSVLDKVVSLKSGIAAARKGRCELAVLRQQLQQLTDDELLSKADELQRLLAAMRECPADLYVLPESEASALTDSCDRLRFRLMAAALSADPLALQERICQPESIPIVQGQGGVIHGRVDGKTIILLPELEVPVHYEAALHDLMSVYDTAGGRRSHWIVDFSSVTSPPQLLFMGIVKALKDDLERYNFTLSICWLRCELLPDALAGPLGQSFQLAQQGGFLFSVARGEK